MDHDKKVKVNVIAQENIVGSSDYTVTIEVTNIGSKELVNLEVKPILIVGR